MSDNRDSRPRSPALRSLHDRYIGDDPEAAERYEQAVADAREVQDVAAERDLLRAALAALVAAKDEKEARGDTPRYRGMKAGAWEAARDALARVPAPEGPR